MRESSAIELRDRWVEQLRVPPGGLRAEAEGGAPAWPSMAIGLTGSGDRHRLAVRLQNRSVATLQAAEAVREEARGEVDVRQIGLVVGLALPIRPLLGGISIGSRRGHPGTLGCVVRKIGTAAPHFLLSNNHVLGRLGFAQPGEVIEQPAAPEQTGSGPFAVAEFGETVALQPQPTPNLIDAAIVPVLPGIAFDQRALFGTTRRLTGVRTTAVHADEPVLKVGKSTHQTTGRIKAWGFRVLTVMLGSRMFDFDDQIEIGPDAPPFCASGDSGSIVFDDSGLALGLLFGKSEITEEAYANPIGTVFSRLSIELA